MGKQICFFEKNFLDLDNESATISASEADDFIKFSRVRSLYYAYLTTGSQDSNNTQIEVDLGAPFYIDTIILADHNFKSYKIERFDNGEQDWVQIFSDDDDTEETSLISISEFLGRRIRITIYGTQVPNSEKKLNRLIITRKIGQFSYWPKIETPVIDQGKVIRKVMSGKSAILRTVGAFRCTLTVSNWRNAQDLALIESLFRQVKGFEVWISGGDEDQFFYASEGYRKRDVYLMGIANNWSPKFKDGIYTNGMDVKIDLVEVVS